MKTRASYLTPASAVFACFGFALFASACGIETDGAAGPVSGAGRGGGTSKGGTGGTSGTAGMSGTGGVGEGGFAGTAPTGGSAGGGGVSGKGGASGAGASGKGGASGAGAGGASGKGGAAGVGGASGASGKGGGGGLSGMGGASGVGGVSGMGGAAGKGGVAGAGGLAGTGGVAGFGGDSGAGGVAGAGAGGIGGAGAGGAGAGGAGAGGAGAGGAGAGGAGAGGAGAGGAGAGGSPLVCSSLEIASGTTGGVEVGGGGGSKNPFELGVEMTLEAWVYPTSYSKAGSVIIGHLDTAADLKGYLFEVGPQVDEDEGGASAAPGTLRLVTAGFGMFSFARATAVVPLLQWSHVVASLVANGPKTAVAFFLNGVPVGQTGAMTPQFAPKPGITIGHRTDLPAIKNFEGFIDEARVSSKVEYTQDFSADLRKRLGAVPNSTEALFHFDETTGTVAKDSSGLGRDATFVAGGLHGKLCP